MHFNNPNVLATNVFVFSPYEVEILESPSNLLFGNSQATSQDANGTI